MNKERPFVSVIMPVRNEAGFLERSLGAVLAQDYPAERVEILAADGMSTDGTREKIAEFQKKDPRVRMLDNPKGIVASGLNQAVRLARGEVIVRVDGHAEIAPDYLTRCVENLEKFGAGAVGGPIQTVGEGPQAEAIALAMGSPFGVGGSAFRTVHDRFLEADTVPFPAFRREALEKAGPFDEELVRNQDDEHNYRMRKLGMKIMLCPDIRSVYYSRAALKGLWSQYFQYGFWKVRVLQKHAQQMQPRQFVPPIFAALLLSFFPIKVLVPEAAEALSLVFGLYAGLNLGVSLAVAAQKRRPGLFLYLPPAFAALHLGYGFGFLTGLMRFWNRWGGR